MNRSRMGIEEEKVVVETEEGKRVVGFLWGLKSLQQEMEGDAKTVAISASSRKREREREGVEEDLSLYHPIHPTKQKDSYHETNLYYRVQLKFRMVQVI